MGRAWCNSYCEVVFQSYHLGCISGMLGSNDFDSEIGAGIAAAKTVVACTKLAAIAVVDTVVDGIVGAGIVEVAVGVHSAMDVEEWQSLSWEFAGPC